MYGKNSNDDIRSPVSSTSTILLMLQNFAALLFTTELVTNLSALLLVSHDSMCNYCPKLTGNTEISRLALDIFLLDTYSKKGKIFIIKPAQFSLKQQLIKFPHTVYRILTELMSTSVSPEGMTSILLIFLEG